MLVRILMTLVKMFIGIFFRLGVFGLSFSSLDLMFIFDQVVTGVVKFIGK